MTHEAYVMVNGHQAKALFDTGTMGDNLIQESLYLQTKLPPKASKFYSP
jgi:hypothetical protein